MDRRRPVRASRSNPEVDFKGQKRSNETHASTSGPEAKLFAKSHKQESVPTYLGHVLMENRSKLALDIRFTQATGTADYEAALEMLADLPGEQRKTVGADKNFDTSGFVTGCRQRNVTRMWRRTPTSTTPRRVSGSSARVATTVAPRAMRATPRVR
jgi:hypothetical protein